MESSRKIQNNILIRRLIMKTKKIAILVLSALIAWVVVSWANADMFNISKEEKMEMQELFHKLKSWGELTDDEKQIIEEAKANFRWFGWKMWFKKWVNWMMKWLTDEEKTALEWMNDEEKKDFFEKKREEKQAEYEAKKAERETHEAVIDKLIDGIELTSEEKVILEEIKAKRAERKLKKQEMEEKREKIKNILEKKRNGEELTSEEEEYLEDFWNHSMRGNMGWKMWKMRWRMYR